MGRRDGREDEIPADAERAWTAKGGGPMAPPPCGAAGLLCCAVGRNLLCTARADKRVHVWDTRTMKHVQEFASHRGAVTRSPCARHGQLFSVSEDRTLKVWSLTTWRTSTRSSGTSRRWWASLRSAASAW